jgi:hypothetical protein
MLRIFAKKKLYRSLKSTNQKLLLPMMTKVPGQILQQNRDVSAHEIYATWPKIVHSQKMHPLLNYKVNKSLKFLS